MKNHWLDRAKKRLQTEENQPGAVFERLQVQGMIDERGEVTGKLHQWDAFLAVTEVKRAAGRKQIDVFRCLKPVFGLPGSATIDIARDSMVTYLKEGKKIITARRDDRLGVWREGCAVHLSDNGWLRCESVNDVEDNVGSLPEFQQTDSRL
jgi:hypothetical protein